MNAFQSGSPVSLRGLRLLSLAVTPFYLVAMLLHLIWVCCWMPDLEADADADGLAWESAAVSASQLNAKRADHLLASSKPSVN